MSAALRRHAPEPVVTDTLPDGSLVITPEQLQRIGHGDAARGRRELRMMIAAEKDRTIKSGPTAKPNSVRIAMQKDEQAVLALLLRDLEENAASVAAIDPDKVLELIQMGTRKKNLGIVGVIDGPDGTPVAACILLPQQWWWSRQWYYMEIVCYVHPDHRRSHHIDDMLNFQRWVSDQMTANFGYRVMLLCGVLGAWRVREKIALYRRRFAQAGAAFVYPSPFKD